jgi:hypothetical protein
LLPLILALIYTTISSSIWISALFSGIVVVIQLILRLSNQLHGHVLQQNGFLNDGEVELDGNPIWASLEYSFKQEPRSILHYALDAILLWGVLFGSFHLISLPLIQTYTQSNWILFAFDWITICLATYPILAKAMTEPNTYHTEDPYSIDAYSRICIVGCMLGCLWFSPSVWILIVMAVIPIGWILGLIPALRILLMTIMERGVVIIFGGTPTTANSVAILQILGRGIMIALLIIIRMYTSPSIFIIASIILGWAASQRLWMDFLFHRKSSNALLIQSAPGKRGTIFRVVQLLIGLAITILILYVAPLPNTIFEFLILTAFATSIVLTEIQRKLVPSFFPVFVNPIRFARSSLLCKLLGLVHTALKFIIPWTIVAFITFHASSLSIASPGQAIWNTVLTARLYSNVWHSAAQLHICLMVYVAMSHFTVALLSGFTFPEVLLLIDLTLTFLIRVYQKTTFWMILLYHFVTHKKERHKLWRLWLPLSIIVSPISVILSSLLDSPCIPLLGLPVMLPSFPRPERFWTSRRDEYRSGNDTILYSSMTPTLLRSIALAVNRGQLPNLDVRQAFLCRFESRLLVIRCIESWNDGNIVEVIATELEPTSCHALEGVAVDDSLNAVLSSKDYQFINGNFAHTMTPVGIVYCAGYMEAIQTTTGIIDSPQFQAAFIPCFFKFLIYELVVLLPLDQVVTFSSIPIQKQILQGLQSLLPASWFQYVKDKSVGYRIKIQNMSASQVKELDSQLINLVISAFAATMGSSNQAHIPLTSSNLFDLYRGVLPFTLPGDTKQWLARPTSSPFRSHCLHAYRNAFKLVYDAIVLQESVQEGHELFEMIGNLRQNWVCSVESTQSLPDDPSCPVQTVKEGLERQCAGVFLLSQPKPQQPVKVRLLTYSKECEVKVASLNPESIKVHRSHVGSMGQFELRNCIFDE